MNVFLMSIATLAIAVTCLCVSYFESQYFLVGAVLIGVGCFYPLVLSKSVYVCVIFGFHTMLLGLLLYLQMNFDRVSTFGFDGSVFREETLSLASLSAAMSMLAILLGWLVTQQRANYYATDFGSLAEGLLQHLGEVRQEAILLLAFLGLFTGVFFFLTNPTVLDVPYPRQGALQWTPSEFFKLPVFAMGAASAICYGHVVYSNGLRSNFLNLIRVLNLIVSFLFLLLVGARGYSTFYFLALAMAETFLWSKGLASYLFAFLFLFLAYSLYVAWPFLRVNLAFFSFLELLSQSGTILLLPGTNWLGESDSSVIYLRDVPMLGQSIMQLLYVVQLELDGISLSGMTFLNLVPNVLPGFLDGLLWTRPISDALLLRDYYSHGGGFLVLANAYWNGGVAAVFFFMFVTSYCFSHLDKYMIEHSGLIFKLMYWLWFPVMFVQLAYGIQGLVRVMQLLVACWVVEHLFKFRQGRKKIV